MDRRRKLMMKKNGMERSKSIIKKRRIEGRN
jgi:hypothetical protein